MTDHDHTPDLGAAYERLTTSLAAPPDAARLVGARVAQRRRRRHVLQGAAGLACAAALTGGTALASSSGPADLTPVGPGAPAYTVSSPPVEAAPPTAVPRDICTRPAPDGDRDLDPVLEAFLDDVVLEPGYDDRRVEQRGDEIVVHLLRADGEPGYVVRFGVLRFGPLDQELLDPSVTKCG